MAQLKEVLIKSKYLLSNISRKLIKFRTIIVKYQIKRHKNKVMFLSIIEKFILKKRSLKWHWKNRMLIMIWVNIFLRTMPTLWITMLMKFKMLKRQFRKMITNKKLNKHIQFINHHIMPQQPLKVIMNPIIVGQNLYHFFRKYFRLLVKKRIDDSLKWSN